MKRDTDNDGTQEERRVEEAVRRLPRPAASAEFCERLRRDFRSGVITGRKTAWWPWAAAAALVLVAGAAILLATREAPWTVIANEGAGTVVVNGQPIAATDIARIARALTAGARVETDARTEIQLLRNDTIALVVTPDSAVRVPAIHGRWWGSTPAVVERGELRGVTGPRFAGHVLRVSLPGATVEVTGTSFAAFRNAEGSCVCVLEGKVMMRDDAGGAGEVAPLRRRVIPPHGGPPREEPIRPMERMKLEMLRDQAREMWARREN